MRAEGNEGPLYQSRRPSKEHKLPKQERDFWELLMRDVEFVLSVVEVKKKQRDPMRKKVLVKLHANWIG